MAFLLEPLTQSIARHVRGGAVIHADDTPVPVLDPGRGKAKTGRLWVAVRDERPWGSGIPPAVFYRYAPDRRAEQAEALLGSCRGFLHADAYSGFNTLYAINAMTGAARLTEVGCWAHARRKIYEVHAAAASPTALSLLEQIGALFAIEDEIRGCAPEWRLAIRRDRAEARPSDNQPPQRSRPRGPTDDPQRDRRPPRRLDKGCSARNGGPPAELVSGPTRQRPAIQPSDTRNHRHVQSLSGSSPTGDEDGGVIGHGHRRHGGQRGILILWLSRLCHPSGPLGSPPSVAHWGQRHLTALDTCLSGWRRSGPPYFSPQPKHRAGFLRPMG